MTKLPANQQSLPPLEGAKREATEKPAIIGLGLTTVDILIRLDQMPTWERGGRLKALKLDGGGPVGTALAAAARLGAKVGFVGTAGNDETGDLKLHYLSREGIDTSRVIRRQIPENQIILVYIHGETAERLFSGSPNFGDQVLTPAELDREYLTSAEYLHLDGYHAEAALQAARWMHAAGKKVVLDAGKTDGKVSPAIQELVRHTDILISGAGFFRALTGIGGADRADLQRAGEAILEMGPSVAIETLGAEGCLTVSRGWKSIPAEEKQAEAFFTPAFPVQALDTTGAGDVFHGAYLVGLLHGWDLRQTATFASAAAAIKCTRLGGRAGIPGFNEVFEFLERIIQIKIWQ